MEHDSSVSNLTIGLPPESSSTRFWGLNRATTLMPLLDMMAAGYHVKVGIMKACRGTKGSSSGVDRKSRKPATSCRGRQPPRQEQSHRVRARTREDKTGLRCEDEGEREKQYRKDEIPAARRGLWSRGYGVGGKLTRYIKVGGRLRVGEDDRMGC